MQTGKFYSTKQYMVTEETLKQLMRLVGYNVSILILDRKQEKIRVSIVCRDQESALQIERIIFNE